VYATGTAVGDMWAEEWAYRACIPSKTLLRNQESQIQHRD